MKTIAMGLVLAALSAASSEAAAQARYVCRYPGGGTYVTNAPCPPSTGNTGGSTSGSAAQQPGIVYYGPDGSSQYRAAAPIPRSGEAPSHLRHMSPHCSSLHDAIRTAHVRGLASDTIQTMQRNYRLECGENESEAARKWSQERGEMAQEKRMQQEADRRDRERASLHAQQCGESKRILFAKRARTDLNEGEKAELKRFEDNYKARCT